MIQNFPSESSSLINLSDNQIQAQDPSMSDEFKQSRTQAFQNKFLFFKVLSEETKKSKTQISFESQFLDNHITAFQCYFSSGKQKNLMMEQQMKFKSVSTEINPIFPNQQMSLFSLVTDCNGLSVDQKEELIKSWQENQHFLNFMKIIVTKIPISMQKQIIYLSCLIWINYLKIDQVQIRFGDDTSKLIQRLTTNLKGNVQDSLKSMVQTLGPNKFKEFLKCYSHTIYLIVEGYFDNPYAPGCFNLDIKPHRSLVFEQRFSFNRIEILQQDIIRLGLPKKMPKLTSIIP